MKARVYMYCQACWRPGPSRIIAGQIFGDRFLPGDPVELLRVPDLHEPRPGHDQILVAEDVREPGRLLHVI